MTVEPEVVESPKPFFPPVKFSIEESTITRWQEEYAKLTINGVDDKKGYDIVHGARMEIKNLRCFAKAEHKRCKAPAIKYGKDLDAELRRIEGLALPVEEILLIEEKKVDDEKARIKAEKERLRQEKIDNRIKAIAKYNVVYPVAEAEHLSDENFAAALDLAREQYEAAEAERVEKEAAAAKAKEEEEKRLAAVREEQEKKEKELAEKEAALHAYVKQIEEKKISLPDIPPPYLTKDPESEYVITGEIPIEQGSKTVIFETKAHPHGYCSIDGDALCITRMDFVNLQESPAVFMRLNADLLREVGGLLGEREAK